MAPRLHLVAALVAAVAVLLASCGTGAGSRPSTPQPGDPGTPPPADPPEFQDGFEQALDNWLTGYDLPPDPDNPGSVVAWSIEASPEQVFEGQRSARYVLDGRQDDGTIWLVRAFDVVPNANYTVSLAVVFWSAQESFNTIAKVAAYAGPVAPVREADFDTSRPLDAQAGWAAYDYTFEVRSGSDGRLWVAFGISAVWETWMTYHADDVRVTIR